ncbi:galactose mutarotase [Weissella diestrammenae]|uniref:Galactose mutarotase n=1 Tax=Weissella diestrammenae TaxID=1162633 RepID=A0A7G9T7N0_9LACO|nr:galactose mutarotase [Weissella diestrammenae]QNN76105.1 galactose mutarotase [Weissella diestrammenae]
MKGTHSDFGSLTSGEKVMAYTLTNTAGTSITILSYGATWQSYRAFGQERLIQFNDLAHYLNNPFHLGNTIGRVGGRLSQTDYELTVNQPFHLTANEGNHVLHSGVNGFDQVNWSAKLIETSSAASVVFTHTFSDEFPGELEAEVKYTLDEDDDVSIKFTGESTATTLFNPMTHVYFNLDGAGTNVLTHQLKMASDLHVVVDDQKIPTGELQKNIGTPFDFSTFKAIGTDIDHLKSAQYDDAFVVAPTLDADQLQLRNAAGTLELAVHSDRNGLVLFTVNPDALYHTPEWEKTAPVTALAIEAQTLPDAISQPDFGDIVLPAKVRKTYTVKYKIKEVNKHDKI